jgi:hypothetical protein
LYCCYSKSGSCDIANVVKSGKCLNESYSIVFIKTFDKVRLLILLKVRLIMVDADIRLRCPFVMVVVMMACIVITVMKCVLSVPCPVPNCICKGVEAVCSGINMTYIPRLPIQISRVSITNGHLRRISASTMTNLTFNNISSEVYSIQHYVIKFVSDLR